MRRHPSERPQARARNRFRGVQSPGDKFLAPLAHQAQRAKLAATSSSADAAFGDIARSNLQLQCRHIQLRNDATQVWKNFPALIAGSAFGPSASDSGVALFAGFGFISGFFQRIDQQRPVFRIFRFAVRGFAKIFRGRGGIIAAQIQQAEIERIVVLVGIKIQRAEQTGGRAQLVFPRRA